jgi:hypothetical protein
MFGIAGSDDRDDLDLVGVLAGGDDSDDNTVN